MLGKKSRITILTIVTLFFFLSMVLGAYLERDNSLIRITQIVLFTICYGYYIFFFSKNNSTTKYKGRLFQEYKYNKFIFNFLILTSLYFIGLLIFAPGIFTFDAAMQLAIILNNDPINPAFSVLHTLIILAFYKLGNFLNSDFISGMIVSFIQLSICSAVIGYTITKMKGLKVWSYFLTIAFFGLWPINLLMPIIHNNTILFSIFFLLLSVLIIEINNTEQKTRRLDYFLIVISIAFCIMLRVNFIYALVVWLIFIIFMRKIFSRKLLLIVFIGTIVGITSNNFLYEITRNTNNVQANNSSGSSSINIFTFLPRQGIASVYNSNNVLNTYEKEVFSTFPDNCLLRYNPRFIDPLFGCVPPGGLRYFFDFSVELLMNHPRTFMRGVLLQIQPLFDPLFALPDNNYTRSMLELNSGWEGINESDLYILTGRNDVDIENHSLLKPIGSILYNFIEKDYIDQIPFISILNSPAFSLWILIAALVTTLLRGNNSVLPISILLMLYYGTIVVGPVAIFRYTWFLFLLVPYLVYYSSQNEISKTRGERI